MKYLIIFSILGLTFVFWCCLRVCSMSDNDENPPQKYQDMYK